MSEQPFKAALDLIKSTPAIVNIGAELFFESPNKFTPNALHVLYSPKAGGNDELAAIADFLLYDDPKSPQQETQP